MKVRTSSAYDGFGWNNTVTADSQDVYDPVGFGGQHGYYRDETGLYLLTHRYYDAGAGRFLTRDPIGYKGGINLYGFAGNNPVNEMDPSGYAGFKLSGNRIVLDGKTFTRSRVSDPDINKGYPHYDGGKDYIDRNGIVRDAKSKMPTGDKVPTKNMPEFKENVGQWDEDMAERGRPDLVRESQMPEVEKEIEELEKDIKKNKPSKFQTWIANRTDAQLVWTSIGVATVVVVGSRFGGPLVGGAIDSLPATARLIPPLLRQLSPSGAGIIPLLAPH